MGVTIFFPASGDPTASLSLPAPALNATVECGTNQAVGRTASGMSFVHSHGNNHYRVTRTFESLTEAEAKDVVDFLRAIRFSAGEVRYRYLDASLGANRDVYCRIVYPTRETKLYRGVRDFTLIFEQSRHPDHTADAISTPFGDYGGGSVGEGADPEPHVTSPLIATGKAGDVFSYTITATGAATVTFGATGLPGWLSRTGAVLSGTPADGDIGDVDVTITATNGVGTDSQTLTIRIDVDDPVIADDPPTVPSYTTSGDLEDVYEGDDVTEVPVLLGSWPIVFTSADLPAWLTLDADTGEITGTAPPASAGPFTWTVTATNSAGFVDQEYSLTVLEPVTPIIVSSNTGSGLTSTEFSKTCVATGGAITWSLGGSPPSWISIDADTGVLSGTPGSTDDGAYTFDVIATNVAGSDTDSTTITIDLPAAPAITSGLSGYPVVGLRYNYQILSDGDGPKTYSWSGSTPAWATLNTETGAITGAATAEADYSFSITVTNDGGSDTQTLELHAGRAPWITSPNSYSFVADVGGTAVPEASGTGTITISITSNTVPSSSVLSSPTRLTTTAGAGDVGNYGFTVTVSNNWGVASKNIGVRVHL